MEQAIEFSDWLQQRCGRFTSSENHKLFTGGRRPMTEDELKEEAKVAKENKRKPRTTVDTLFGEGSLTYISTKAAERLTLAVKDESNFIQTNWGKEYEWDACEAYEAAVGQKGTYYGVNNPKFFEFGEYGGCSPDWIYKKKGADFKCPYNSAEHLINLQLKSQEDFKAVRWEYYCQAQSTMHQLKLNGFDFVSYDKRFIEPKYRLKILNIKPDLEWYAEFEVRLPAAIEIMNNIINSL